MLPLAVYGMAAPYISRALSRPVAVDASKEVVDHVVPGLVVVAVALLTLATRRLTLVGSLLATLAGFWMTATHVGLLLQAQRGEVGVTWEAALIHSLGGIAILIVAVAGSVFAWNEASPDDSS